MSKILLNLLSFNFKASRKLMELYNKKFDRKILHDKSVLKLVKKKTDAPVVVDIGAYKGTYTDDILSCFPESQVYCFEPISHLSDALELKYKKNKKIKVFNVALGDENKKIDLCVNEYLPATSILKPTENNTKAFPFIDTKTKNIKIDQKRLDDLASEYMLMKPDLVKIDVQGYEKMVFQGGMKYLTQSEVIVTEVSFENVYENGVLVDELSHLLVQMNYSLFGIYGWLYSRNGTPVQADFIFIKNS